MTCPKCGKRAIRFTKWFKGSNAFATTCESCSANLRANQTTVWGFVVTLLVMIPLVVFAAATYDKSMGPEKSWRFVAVAIPALIGAAITYAKGGYVSKDQ